MKKKKRSDIRKSSMCYLVGFWEEDDMYRFLNLTVSPLLPLQQEQRT
jgi:hypothetical protein